MVEARAGAVLVEKGLGAPVRVFQFLRRWPVIPVVVLTALIAMALFAPLIAPHPPLEGDLRDRNLPPAWYAQGSWKYLLGTDPVGRDVFSRLVFGSRISLAVAAMALATGTVVGTAIGLLSGYFGGVLDEVIMRIVDVWFAFPFLLIALL